jgi:hypothetical protein
MLISSTSRKSGSPARFLERIVVPFSNSQHFSQLLSLVDRNRFAKLVRETGSERRSKRFASWDHFVAMLFCQLAHARSLREIDGGLSSCEGKLKHLGMAGAPGRSTLSYANAHRSSDLFEKLFYQVLGNVSLHAPGKKFRFKSKLYSLDNTVIELCASMFDLAKFRATKGAAKLHLLLDHDGHLPCYARITDGKAADVTVAQQLKLPQGPLLVMDRDYNDYRLFDRWTTEGVGFVTRLKKNALWASHEERPVKPGGKILRDTVGRFFDFDASRRIETEFRRVTVWIEEKGEEMELLTNRFDLSAETIADGLQATLTDRTVFQGHQTEPAHQNLRRHLGQHRHAPAQAAAVPQPHRLVALQPRRIVALESFHPQGSMEMDRRSVHSSARTAARRPRAGGIGRHRADRLLLDRASLWKT